MSKDQFDVNCEGCKPAIIDPETKEILPSTHPYMIAITTLWDEQSLDAKMAWHRVTCKNLRDPADLKLTQRFIDQFSERIRS